MAKTALEQWDETAANNTDVGGIVLSDSTQIDALDNIEREQMAQVAKWLGDDTVASAATADLGAVPGRYINITGTTTITAFGTIKAGTVKYVKFAGALTLTHNATSLILPGAANITTAAGDTAIMVSEGSGNWRCVSYQRAAAIPLTYAEGTWTPELTFDTPGDLSAAYSVQIATYERNGRTVVARFHITTSTFTHTTASGSVKIAGLPLTSANNAPEVHLGALQHSNIASAYQLALRVDSNEAFIRVVGSTSGGAGITLNTTHFPTGTAFTIRGTITYRV